LAGAAMNEHAYDVKEHTVQSMSRYYLGIDPGKSGGLAMVSNKQPPMTWKMPQTEADLFAVLDGMPTPEFAIIEKVHSTPQMGVKSAFTFGRYYGMLLGTLTAWQIPFSEERPQVWQKHMKCLSRGDKNVTKRRAQQLYPGVPITHATADAILIARYCMEVHG